MIEFIEVLLENQDEKEKLIIELLLKVAEDLSKSEDMPSAMLCENALVIYIDGALCSDDMIKILTKRETAKVLNMRSEVGSVIVIQSTAAKL